MASLMYVLPKSADHSTSRPSAKCWTCCRCGHMKREAIAIATIDRKCACCNQFMVSKITGFSMGAKCSQPGRFMKKSKINKRLSHLKAKRKRCLDSINLLEQAIRTISPDNCD